MTPRMLANMANCTSVIMLLPRAAEWKGGRERCGVVCVGTKHQKDTLVILSTLPFSNLLQVR